MTMAVLVYLSTADATKALNSCAALIPEGSERSSESEGERSMIELCEGREDHWKDCGCCWPGRWVALGGDVMLEEEPEVVVLLGNVGGRKVHAWVGSM